MGIFCGAIANLMKITYVGLTCIFQGMQGKCGLPQQVHFCSQKYD